MTNSHTFLTKVIYPFFKGTYLFDKFRNCFHHGFKVEKNILINEIKDLKNKKILDFGCGIGQYSVLFDSESYIGVDIDEIYIKFAKKTYKKKFVLIEKDKKLNFGNNHFDYIFTIATIHHISDDELIRIFNEFNRILKKDGILIIIDHIPVNLQTNLIGRFILSLDRGHYIRSPKDVNYLIEKYFKIKEQYFIKTGLIKDYVLVFIKN